MIEANNQRLPDWLPHPAQRYVAHTTHGVSIRELARRDHLHASTILRQIRRLEQARDDPLIDDFFATLTKTCEKRAQDQCSSLNLSFDEKDELHMTIQAQTAIALDEKCLKREARRVLRRLCETDAILIVSQDMDKAIVVKHPDQGTPTRTATLSRAVAQAFVVKDWLSCFAAGKITKYRITEVGKAALKRFLAEDYRRKSPSVGGTNAENPFLTQHIEWGTRLEPDMAEKLRVNLAESPLGVLARKKDKSGQAFLPLDLVLAGERLREDFEMAQMGQRVAQNWENFLTGGNSCSFSDNAGPAEGPTRARNRVARALKALGPGLGDIALRVCCYLEGLETAEKRMGWSARSGKIVLRIALQRLHAYYQGVN